MNTNSLGYDMIEKGESPCVKVRYEVKRKETKLFMFSESGKLVHQTPISLVLIEMEEKESKHIHGNYIEQNGHLTLRFLYSRSWNKI